MRLAMIAEAIPAGLSRCAAPYCWRHCASRLARTGIVAAVDLASQARYLQERSGPCAGCAARQQPGQDNGPGSAGHGEPSDAP